MMINNTVFIKLNICSLLIMVQTGNSHRSFEFSISIPIGIGDNEFSLQLSLFKLLQNPDLP